jgi:hypothetical protein
VYTWYHTSAIEKASRLSGTQLTPEQRQELTRSALFDEAFAPHFLEDVYAAGHVAGSWGDASQRMGTHDYYNEHGLEVFMWDGRKSTVVLMGDAHMRAQDAELTANAVRSSLTQVLDAAAGQAPLTAPARPSEVPLSADDFNVCKTNAMPARTVDDGGGRYRPAVDEIVAHTPVPGLTPGLGARPRFREEIGPFVGFAGGIDGRVVNNGYDKEKTTHGYLGGVDVALRLGLGLDGVLDESGDGLIFAQAGYRFTSASTNKFIHYSGAGFNGDLTSAIPAERGLALRFRMPFYLIPGDLLLLSPLYFLNRDAYAQMAVTAANGGLIPWQLGLATRFGRFQFVLGRELGVTLYGLDGNQQLLNFTREGQLQIVNYKSIGYDLPVLEYRPYRQFSTDQSSSILFQLFIGLEVPYGVSVDSPPDGPPAHLDDVWSAGLRMIFTWRRYFGGQ